MLYSADPKPLAEHLVMISITYFRSLVVLWGLPNSQDTTLELTGVVQPFNISGGSVFSHEEFALGQKGRLLVCF